MNTHEHTRAHTHSRVRALTAPLGGALGVERIRDGDGARSVKRRLDDWNSRKLRLSVGCAVDAVAALLAAQLGVAEVAVPS